LLKSKRYSIAHGSNLRLIYEACLRVTSNYFGGLAPANGRSKGNAAKQLPTRSGLHTIGLVLRLQ
jgi:hypothetical protein